MRLKSVWKFWSGTRRASCSLKPWKSYATVKKQKTRAAQEGDCFHGPRLACLGLTSFQRLNPFDISFTVKLARRAFVGHVTNFTEDRPLWSPGVIMLSDDRPGNAGIAIRISTVQLVAIV